MNSYRKKPAFPWPLVALFLVIAATSIILGLLFYSNQKKTLLNDRRMELSGIADLKVRQIAQWRLERLGDGRFAKSNTVLIRQIEQYLRGEDPDLVLPEINRSLKALTDNYDYRNILIIDTAGSVVISYPEKDFLAGSHLKQVLEEVMVSGEVMLTDIHQAEAPSYVHLDLIVPLTDPDSSDTAIIAFMAFRINPEEVLFSLIQTWPVPGRTAESNLLRQEGDEVIFLNKPRFNNQPELSVRRPVHEEKLPEAMAFRGVEATTDGIDYRGAAVVAVMKKVPGSPWYLVAKMDHNEILATLDDRMTMVTIIIILFILTTGLFLGILEWNENVRFYRRKYEAELDRLALVKHFDYILKYANDIIFLTDRNLTIIEANDKALESYQYDRSELIGMNLFKIISPEKRQDVKDSKVILDAKGSGTFETVHLRKDNTTFPVEISARMVEIEGVKYYQSICRNITERKEAEEALRESEERFRKIFEESPLGIAMTGKDLGIIRANQSFCKMIGYSEDELKSFTFGNFTHPDYLAGEEIPMMQLLAEEIPNYHAEKQYIRKDGSIIWGSATISVIRNNNDEVQYFMAMVEDVTPRKQAEIELEKSFVLLKAAKEKAEESDRLKTAFLHNVSHEIRTPMNAIIGFSALLSEPDTTEKERQEYIDIIFQSGSQLLSIINDIVDIANVESGQVKLNLREMNLNLSLKGLRDQFKYKLQPGTVTINLATGLPDDQAIIHTDSIKLIQVLSNLINNATKFTIEGRIDFGYSVSDGLLEFYVRDTGIGIPPEFHNRIFERFYQVDNSASKKFSGTGLGLSIVKAYVELLGGRIKLDSAPGQGTEFTFTVPYRLLPRDPNQ